MHATTYPSTNTDSTPVANRSEVRPCLRGDVAIHPEPDGGGLLILAAGSDAMKSFSFGPHEFLMVRSLDGKRTLEELHAALVVQPGLGALRIENIERQIDWLIEMDLLEVAEIQPVRQTPIVVQAEPADRDSDKGATPLVARRRVGRRILSAMAQAACVAALVWGAELALEWQSARSAGELADSAATATQAAPAAAVDRNDGALVPEFDGVLSELFVRDGDKVQAGEILASIDNLEIRKVLAELRGDLEQCQHRRDEAYAEHDWSEYRLQVLHMAELTQRMGQLRFEEEVAQLRAPHAGVIHADHNLSERVGKVVTSGQMLMSVKRADGEPVLPYLATSSMVQ